MLLIYPKPKWKWLARCVCLEVSNTNCLTTNIGKLCHFKSSLTFGANVGQELTDVHVQPPHRGVDGVGGPRFTVTNLTNLTNLTTVTTLASGQDLGQAQPPPPHSAPPLLTSTNGQPAPMVSAGAADLLHVENIFS